jgi:hypothetical protein
MTVENVYQQGEVLSTDLYLHDPFVASDRTDIQFAELIARNIFHEQRGLENDQQESPTQQTLKFSQELSNAGQPHLIGYSEDVPFILITDFRDLPSNLIHQKRRRERMFLVKFIAGTW